MDMQSTKQENGMVSELLAASHYVRNGYRVSKPISDFCEYDLVVDDGSLNRVQVKTVFMDKSKNRWIVSCANSHIRGNGRKPNKKYTCDSFDILSAVHAESGTVYHIPVAMVAGRRSLTVYPYGKPNTVNGRYEDFEQFSCNLLGANPRPIHNKKTLVATSRHKS